MQEPHKILCPHYPNQLSNCCKIQNLKLELMSQGNPKYRSQRKLIHEVKQNKPISYKSTTTNNRISSQLTKKKKKPLPKNPTPSPIVVVAVYKSHRHPTNPICGFHQLHSLTKPSLSLTKPSTPPLLHYCLASICEREISWPNGRQSIFFFF